MKRATMWAAGLLPALLTACHSGPSVSAENASVNEVDAKTSAAGMTPARFMSPGHWDTVTTIHAMTIPGLAPESQAKMNEQNATPQKSSHCLTEAEAKAPTGKFFGADKSCTYDHFRMTDGTIDAVLTCKGDASTQTTTMKGTFTADTFNMDVSTTAAGTEADKGMRMAMSISAQRNGQCTGTEPSS